MTHKLVATSSLHLYTLKDNNTQWRAIKRPLCYRMRQKNIAPIASLHFVPVFTSVCARQGPDWWNFALRHLTAVSNTSSIVTARERVGVYA